MEEKKKKNFKLHPPVYFQTGGTISRMARGLLLRRRRRSEFQAAAQGL
jgi:hypothetical protein